MIKILEIIKQQMNNKKTKSFYLIPIIIVSIAAYFVGSLTFELAQNIYGNDPQVITASTLGLLFGFLNLVFLGLLKVKKLEKYTMYLLLALQVSIIISIVSIGMGTDGYLKYYG